jgi:16S rRNA (guanine966-N2)-methyltransferase
VKKHKSQETSEELDKLYEGDGDITITPYLSSKEIYERLGAPKPQRDPVVYDAQGGPDADLWNKGSENFKARRRAAMRKKGDERWIEQVDEGPQGGKGKRRGRKMKEEPELRERSKRNKNVGSEPGLRGDAVGLRIIGGFLRGSKLEYSGDRRVRPMKARVREAIFNLLGETPKGRYVVDLFAGTGALALEAISRGAESAMMIEAHFPTARVARRNIATLDEKVPGVAKKIELMTTDVYFWSRRLAVDGEAPVKLSPIETTSRIVLPTDVPWLVFCSPPYDFWVDREEETLGLLRALRERAPKGSTFVIEADDRFDFDLLEVEIPERKRRSYPPAEIAIFTV